MKAVILRIKLLQPLLVTRPGAGEENSSEAYSYIPGSVLRGALIGRYLSQNPSTDISAPGQKRPFFDESCLFLNAYPVAGNGKRAFPCPLSWRRDKSSTGGTAYDFAIEEADLKKPAGFKKEFAQIAEKKVEFISPERFMQVHNASLKRGVKEANNSFVYRYEALAAGLEFEAAVIGDGSQKLCDALDLKKGDQLQLGGSRSANYGHVELIEVKHDNDWKESEPGEDINGSIILTLLSDAILINENGQPALHPDDYLGAKHQQAFTRMRLTGGFNRKWGLQLPQSPAVQAGSVFVYKAEEINKEDLGKILENGIGERRVEGFGRVAINLHTQAQYNPMVRNVQPAVELQSEATALTHQTSKSLAQKMAERQLRTQLETAIASTLTGLIIENPPKSSQLSRLRAAARLAIQLNNLAVIPAHVDSLKTAADQLERARIRDKNSEGPSIRLNEWLRNHVDPNPTETWTVWSKYLQKPEEIKVAGVGVPEETMKQLQIEFSARLLDALFRRTAREIQNMYGKKGGINGRSKE